MLIHGITIELLTKEQTGTDRFNQPIYDKKWIKVENVLVGQPTTEDIANELALYKRRLAYILAIPKNDSHDWENTRIRVFGHEFMTYGIPVQGIDELIPGPWNKQVKCEIYE